ncbi:MAG: hypothetical protein NC206_03515 [Bacteroides sp.]|nr:hypothetical protein [Roseburia sp.]MCM1346134.1 hypothetical protein [Bacteroides sp.]MCM1421213.1 hypothetical protein [Bacteroides sp.]
MRKLMMFVGTLLAVTTVNAQEVVTVPFTTAQINVPARVRFVYGTDYSFSVESGDMELASQLQCGVREGVLNFKLGKSLKPGSVVFDEKSNTYLYGVEVSELPLADNHGEDNMLVITVTAPGMPEFKTSKDYKAFPVKNDENVQEKALAFNDMGE